ncbi:MAG: hypothetical protein E7Z67_04815 [Thermoplasmata archaeon]|nr:hypothetical protein [Thermoplasmata archaeon]
MKHENGHKVASGLMAIAILLSAFVPYFVFTDDADAADGSGEEGVNERYLYSIPFISSVVAVSSSLYMIWDFGDGTVLDGRWDYYVQQESEGVELSETLSAGVSEYKALLSAHGNNIKYPTHTYSDKGTYTVTQITINPQGYKAPGALFPFDGFMSNDHTGFDGGLAAGITPATYNDEDRTISGAWSEPYVQTVTVMGYPTITFDSNGGSAVESQVVENGYDYRAGVEPTQPTKDGYTFVGWFKDSELTKPYDWSSKVKKDMTLYAGWGFTLSFDSNGGSAVDDFNVVEGQKATKPANPTKEGFTFNGWYTDEGCTVAYDWSAPVVQDGTLYAKWVEYVQSEHTVSFVTNGGSSVDDLNVVEGQKAIKPTDPTKDGHTFAGWYKDSALAQAYDWNSTVTGDLTLYAKWTVNTYEVVFVTNGGSAVEDISVMHGQKAIKPTDPTKDGHTFAGWYKDSALAQAYDWNSTVTGDLTLYAKWTANAPVDVPDDEEKDDGSIVSVIAPIGLLIGGAAVVFIGTRTHPAVIVAGIVLAIVGVLDISGIWEIFNL